MTKYFAYHCHSMYSKMDSTATPEQYIDRLKEAGHTAICFSEHGNISNFIKKKQLADKAGLKYVHGAEMYLTEKLYFDEERESLGEWVGGVIKEKKIGKIRDNYHVILIAKNFEGVKELNELISLSNDTDHMYYNPRISFDEYFNISDNIIKISACLGGVLNKIEYGTELFYKFVESFDFLEIQHHKHPDQVAYNRMLASLDKQLIAGTDTHEITQYGAECRAILMQSKGQSYGDEDSFDLTFKTYDELVEAYRQQDSIPEEIFMDAIDNTNILEEMIEPFELDYTFKYPTDYEDEEGTIRELAYRNLELENIDSEMIDVYKDRIETELESFSKVKMSGFMLYMGDIASHCIENDIVYGPGRGSCTGSLVAYLLKITDVDPIVWGTNFSRFVNDSRISLGDIDTDYPPEDRAKIYEYIRNRSTDVNSCYIATFGKLSTKSIIDNVSRALNVPLDRVSEIKKGYAEIEEKEKRLIRKFENGGMSEKEYEQELEDGKLEMRDYISKFEDIFYYYDGLDGVIVSEGKHACGMIGSPINVRENIGLRYDNKSSSWVSQCDMKSVDSVNFVKFDVLSLKTLQVIKHTYKLIGKQIPRAKDIDWDDKAVYESMAMSPVGLFQMESPSTFHNMAKFAPRNLREIALVSAVVRPSCDSFREDLISRNFYYNASENVDKLLTESYGRLVYQEQIITFLQEICGFSGQEADNIRRCIGKKDLETLKTWIPKIEQGYIKISDKDEDTARAECVEFIQVMKDAGSYSFSYNHALAYSMITYMTAYLRHYHPVEFITAYLNNASNEDDIINGTELAKHLNIEIKNPEFGVSIGRYSIKDKTIYKGIGSVLYVSDVCANDLYQLHSEVANLSFTQVLAKCLALRSTDTRKIRTLLRIGYFKKYGLGLKLDKFFDYFDKYNGKKQLKKEGLPNGTKKIVEKMLNLGIDGFSETKSLYKFDYIRLLEEMFDCIKNEDFNEETKVSYELSYLGYLQSDIDAEVATVKYISTKNSSYCVEYNRGGGTRWMKLRDGLEPLQRDDKIIIHSEAKGYIVSYTKIIMV
ncbi:MAG: PHP domain-containing protein [Cellulosilyticaceae bacterium]